MRHVPPPDQGRREMFYDVEGVTKSDQVLIKARERTAKGSVRCWRLQDHTPAALLTRSVGRVPSTIPQVLMHDPSNLASRSVRPLISKCGPWTSSISTAQEPVRSANSHPPPRPTQSKHPAGPHATRVLRRLTGDLMPAATLPGSPSSLQPLYHPHEAWFPLCPAPAPS